MVQTNAQRQAQYRQRVALERLRNEYSVTLMLDECSKAGIDVWPTLLGCANDVFKKNGDGLRLIRNVSPLIYAFALTRNLIETQADRPG